MANFCTKCGKKLEKDERCTCEKIKKESNNIKNFDLFNIISEFIKNPYDTMKNTNLTDIKYFLLILSSLSIGLVSSLFVYTSYINYFLSFSITSFIVFIILAMIINIVLNSVCQEKVDFNNTLNIISLSSIHIFIGNIISFILAFASFKLGTLVSILFMILFIIDITMGLVEKRNLNRNKIGYVLIGSLLITVLISILLFKIF